MTISPIRITGGEPTFGEVPPAGVVVEYEPPFGTTWVLSSDGDRYRNIFLQPNGISGLRGKVEWDESESVNQYGVRRTGRQNFRTPPLDISLNVGLRAERGEMESLVRRWDQAWSFFEPGKLRLRSAGFEFWTPVVDPVFPDWPDNLVSRRYLEVSMSCRALKGHWFGKTRVFGAGSFSVTAEGDAPLVSSCRLVWDGQATSFQVPGGQTVDLQAVSGQRFINLDRGMTGQVTTTDGVVDSVTWSALLGKVHGVSLDPGSVTQWQLGAGLTLEVTPRYLSPWR